MTVTRPEADGGHGAIAVRVGGALDGCPDGTMVFLHVPLGWDPSSIGRHALAAGWVLAGIDEDQSRTAQQKRLRQLPVDARVLVMSPQDRPDLVAALRRHRPVQAWASSRLQATVGEAHTYLADVGDARVIERLVALCAGWPEALEAARQSWLSGLRDSAELDVTIARHAMATAWSAACAGDRALLLRTASIDRLHPALVVAITGDVTDWDRFEQLVATGVWIQPPIPGSGTTYWMRPALSTTFLRDLVDRPCADDLRLAAQWFADRGDIDGQVRHLARAGDHAAAKRVVAQHESTFFEHGRHEEVLGWYDLLPTKDSMDRCATLLRRAWADELAGRTARASTLARRLEFEMEQPSLQGDHDNDAVSVLRVEVHALCAWVALNEADPMTALRHADATLATNQSWPSTNGQALAPVLKVRALTWLGRFDEALHEAQALDQQPSPSKLFSEVARPTALAAALLGLGRVREASALCRSASQALGELEAGEARPTALVVRLTSAMCDVDLGHVHDAELQLRSVLAEAESQSNLSVAVMALLGLARAAGPTDPIETFDLIRRGRQLLVEAQPMSPFLAQIALTEAALRLDIGDAVRCSRLLARVPESPARSLILDRLSRQRRASTVPRPGVQERPHDVRHTVYAELSRAESLAEGQRDAATKCVYHALQHAESAGLMLCLVGRSEALLDVAESVARREGNDAYDRMLALARVRPRPPATGSARLLAAGDLELLALLTEQATNAEMAQRLGVSPNTIKTRLKRLYSKLDVHSRADAVRVARARGVLAGVRADER